MSDRQVMIDPAVRVAIFLMATILTFIALKLGQDVFAPLILALVTGVILGPFTDLLQRAGLPVALAAISVLAIGVISIAGLALAAEPLIWRIVDELPKLKWEISNLIAEFRGIIQGLDEVNKEVEEVLGAVNESEAAPAATDETAMPTVTDALFLAPVLVAHFLIFAGSLFFFLLTRQGIYDWISRFLEGDQEEGHFISRVRCAEKMVSRYVLTISIINLGLGVTLALLLWLIGLPAPFVWGVAATLLNFVLYLGPLVLSLGLLLAGLVAFSGAMVVVPMLIFLTLNIIESQLVTPSTIGKHISVNPLLVFVSLLFWLWLWGPVGGIIAIPILVIALVMLNLSEEPTESA
ncbi:MULTISPECIES: AI-2E family transporter [unclassified Roseovarius]|uniref:AI-2E family transporter n=1 Tax=unclassified Roseovarius TaxID=2614913 RepID=UPI00273FAAC7|nr:MULTISPECIES: AI-2E family transporter [unclassified Roseovarius]